MDPKHALDFFAAAARRVLVIEQINDYNAAIQALGKLIEDEKARKASAEESAKA